MADTNTAAAAEVQNAPGSGQASEESLQRLQTLEKFFEDITPVLKELEKNPEIVEAIVSGKLTPDFAKAAMEGTLTVKEAEAATAAVAAVTEEVGQAAVNAMTPDDLTKLVEEKMNSFKKEFTEKEEQKEFEAYTNKFIAETSDFSQHADAIAAWLEEHKDITDVRVAYFAVKGEMSVKEARDAASKDAAEAAKNVILNASGGGVTAQFTPDGTPVIDRLIASKSNPNSIF